MATLIGPLHVRRSAFIRASAARVEFSIGSDAEQKKFGGRVLVLEAERELTFESNWQPLDNRPVPTFWTFRLTPAYDGTLVELFHHGFESLGADAADALESYEQGWDMKRLSALRAIIEGQ